MTHRTLPSLAAALEASLDVATTKTANLTVHQFNGKPDTTESVSCLTAATLLRKHFGETAKLAEPALLDPSCYGVTFLLPSGSAALTVQRSL
jgi:hypothetical protein